jgi:hypothetical protein
MKETLINFRATKAERAMWHMTAQTLGTSISEICREALDLAVSKAIKMDAEATKPTHGPAHDQQ